MTCVCVCVWLCVCVLLVDHGGAVAAQVVLQFRVQGVRFRSIGFCMCVFLCVFVCVFTAMMVLLQLRCFYR